MSEQLQLRRNTAANIAGFVGQIGELAIDTTNQRICVNDYVTPGGFAAGIERRTPVADLGYNAVATDRIIAYTSISAPRTVALPAATGYPSGARFVVVDESGSCSATNTITVTRNATPGTDTVDGGVSIYLSTAYGRVELESDGSSKWTIIGSSNVAQSPHGANTQFAILEAGPVTLSGATTTYNPTLPSNSTVLGVSTRVTTGITGCTTWDLGYSGSPPGQFGTGLNPAINSVNATGATPVSNFSVSTLTFTAVGGAASFSAGAVRLAFHLLLVNGPIS